MTKVPLVIVALVAWAASLGTAQSVSEIHWKDCLWQPKTWYSSNEAMRVAENVLLYQYPSGGWPKNIDMAPEPSAAEKDRLKAENHLDSSTIDNGATYTQIRFLAKVYQATGEKRYAESFLRGLDYLLKSQYPNGGWPQFYPLRQGYYSHITFNDDAMIGAMKLLEDVSQRRAAFTFIDDHRRERSRQAVEKGIECILKCQLRIDGKLTAWCAQHDEQDYAPAKARSYELPSLSGEECVGIVQFLMTRQKPSDEVKTAIQSAVAWFDKVRINGIRVIEVRDKRGPEGKNRIVVRDTSAPSMWARFYEIGTNKPFFCSRDGIMRDSLSQISYERRNHYSWLGYWPQRLLTNVYPEWARKNGLKSVLQQ